MPVEKTPSNVAEPDKKEEHQPTLKDILADKEMSRGFNVYLEGQGKQEVIAKMLSGGLERADLDSLAEERQNFLERMTQEKEMREILLSGGNLQEFIKNSPDLTRISELVGEDGIKEALATVFHEKALAGQGDSTHKDMFADYTKWAEAATKFVAKNKEMENFLQQRNLTLEEAEKVRGVDDPDERKDLIAEILTQKGLGPEKVKGWFWKKNVWSEEQQAIINETAEEMSDKLKSDGSKTKWTSVSEGLAQSHNEAEKAQKQIMESIDSILSDSGGKEIGRILMAEKKPEEKGMSFNEVQKGIVSAKDPEKIRSEFSAYAEESFSDFVEMGQYDLNNLPSQGNAVNKFFESFKGQMVAKAAEKSGFWGAIYEAIIGPFLEEFLPELKKQTTVDKQNKKLSIPKKKK